MSSGVVESSDVMRSVDISLGCQRRGHWGGYGTQTRMHIAQHVNHISANVTRLTIPNTQQSGKWEA